MDLIERFRYIMKLNAMTASQFADEIGVQRSSISHILSGRNKPSLEFIQKVINRFPKVDSTWLINGKTNVGSVPKIETKAVENQKVNTPISEIKEEVESKQSSQSNPPEVLPSSKSIKKIVAFYDDGTFEEFLSR
jgi:transcriptional regulator with XRE-family HTH domain